MMAAEAAGDETGSPSQRQKTTFLDLPLETQREIISHCSQTDLICVSLVSKHFHELSSAQLYRNFHIIFPDDDDLDLESPIDGLAGGLDTFTTSEYNYAQHLRDLSMDTLSAGVKGEISYQPYLYSSSCGKFLNTLLYLTLKKAKSLEAFKWNIRVELSRQVYRELHRIPSLKRVHLRMQAGQSYYIPPPPLPSSGEHHTPEPESHWATSIPPSMPSVLSLPLYGAGAPDAPSALVPPSKQLPKSKLAKRDPSFQEPPTLSGFKDLRSLVVLDIDDLDIVTELKDCIQNSSSTLQELQLSLSESLALQARKPAIPVDSDPDDSDVDDDFALVPPSGNHDDGGGPARVFRAQQERKVQESFLGRVFDVIDMPTGPDQSQDKDKAHQGTSEAVKKEDDRNNEGDLDPHAKFISSLRTVSEQLMKIVDGPRQRTQAHVDVLETIEKAARKYVHWRRPDLAESLDEKSPVSQGESSAPIGDLPTDPNADDQKTQVEKRTNSKDNAGRDADGLKPGQTPLDHCTASASLGTKLSKVGKDGCQLSPKALRLMSQVAVYQTELERVKLQLSEISFERDTASSDEVPALSRRVEEHERSLNDISRKLEKTKSDLSEASAADESYAPDAAAAVGQEIRKYLKETRGFCLESLSIYLVPMKASVLSRAIDLRSLRQLTLLNVGTQAPIWSLLAKENRVQPLPLRSVFTDNVSDAFLSCMSQLEELHELFMLERSIKSKPESFAPRTTNTVDQIRRVVLTKHMPTLKRLMIKDESACTNWDTSEKTMIYICTRGKQLEELAINLNIQAVHAFMQYFGGLPKLRALHILRFKNDDTCHWVMREILYFIVDNLSHHPSSKLEWIAMQDHRLDRVVRISGPSERAKTNEENQRNSKGKSPASPTSSSDEYPVIPAIGLDDDFESDSDDELDDRSRLRFKAVGPHQFYDAWNVKIFEKEMRCGRL